LAAAVAVKNDCLFLLLQRLLLLTLHFSLVTFHSSKKANLTLSMPNSIDVIFTPDLLPFANLTGKVVVVADILRATTTITFALVNGAASVIPALSSEEAFRLAAGRENILIGGERQGVKVDGFHLGNSPREYTRSVVQGKEIVLTTTNGTRALRAGAVAADYVIVGAFTNLSAIVKTLRRFPGGVVLACSGREGGFCLEDTVFAGACVNAMPGGQLTDAAEAAKILYQTYQRDLPGMLKNCYHGRFLSSIGLEADLEVCAQTNLFDIVPRLVDGKIVAGMSGG
jgi:2-phosphosulfolactate phosphatase